MQLSCVLTASSSLFPCHVRPYIKDEIKREIREQSSSSNTSMRMFYHRYKLNPAPHGLLLLVPRTRRWGHALQQPGRSGRQPSTASNTILWDGMVHVTCRKAGQFGTYWRQRRERKPPPSPKSQAKVIRDSNLDFWINPDPHICQIASKKKWIHSVVGRSHSAKYRKIGWSMYEKC